MGTAGALTTTAVGMGEGSRGMRTKPVMGYLFLKSCVMGIISSVLPVTVGLLGGLMPKRLAKCCAKRKWRVGCSLSEMSPLHF